MPRSVANFLFQKQKNKEARSSPVDSLSPAPRMNDEMRQNYKVKA